MLAAVSGCHRGVSPDVMATVNGKQITRAELDKAYNDYLASMGQSPQAPSPEQAEIVRLNILHQMIEDEILQQRAAKLNLAATDEDVNAKLTEMKAPFTEEEFAAQLKRRNLNLDDLKRDLRRSLTKEKLLNKEIESKVNISDADISTYYTGHKSEFNLIEPMYHLAQIVVTTAPSQQSVNLQNNKASGEADARKKIQVLHNRLQSGEDFGTVAMNFSENPNNASNGGDMGFVAESALHSDPAAYDAITKLKPGQITDVLPVYDNSAGPHRIVGYAIYKLIAREPAGQRAMNDPRVQQTIRQFLRESHAQLLKNAYFEMLHDQAKVRNYYAEQILKNGGAQ
ncbi:MAG TPA: SurA N-terminal domain-containing protein [Terracidiphilus sp.]|nr:SurA N-terminal domain-containing protein [Terracidiphilus sp.]